LVRLYCRCCIKPVQDSVRINYLDNRAQPKYSQKRLLGSLQRNGTVVANREDRTRRVDKGKSGQAQKTAVSGGFGGGILSQL
jgi:hypothetical protein